MTDPIADMLTRIRNGISAKHTKVDIPASRLKVEIARILKEEGYITNYSIKVTEDTGFRTLRVFLRFGPKGESTISEIVRVSRSSRRVYVGSQQVPRVLGGLGINILSTSHGVMTGKAARRANGSGMAQLRVPARWPGEENGRTLDMPKPVRVDAFARSPFHTASSTPTSRQSKVACGSRQPSRR